MSSQTTSQQPAPAAVDEATALKYRAFVSYRWKSDTGLAHQLRRDLQRLGKKIFARRARAVFVDTSELGASPSLWSKLRSSLENSEWLIFLASPEATDPSAYVTEEVEEWIANRGTSHVLVALVDGKIAWDRTANDFDRDATTALPEVLLDALSGPGYTDLRKFKDRRDLSLDQPDWREKVAELVDPLEGPGVTKGDLIDEDIAIANRRKRLRNGAIASLIVLALLVGIAGVVAINNGRRAEERRRDALARQLAAQSLSVLDSELDLSLLLATESSATSRLPATLDALLHAVHGRPELLAYLRDHGSSVLATRFTPGGEAVLTVAVEGLVRRWDLGTGVGEPVAWADPTSLADFSDDGMLLATEVNDRVVSVIDTTRWQPVADKLYDGPPGVISAIAVDAISGTVAIASDAGEVWVYELDAPDRPALEMQLSESEIHDVALAPGGALLATAGDDGRVVVVDVDVGLVLHRLAPEWFKLEAGLALFAVAFSPDGSEVAAGGFDEIIHIWDVSTGELLGDPLLGQNGTVSALAYGPSGTTLASGGYDATVIVWDLATGDSLSLEGHSGSIGALSFGADGAMLASGGNDHLGIVWQVDGTPVGGERLVAGPSAIAWIDETRIVVGKSGIPLVVDVATDEVLVTMTERMGDIADIAASSDGEFVVTGDFKGFVTVFDATTGSLMSEEHAHDSVEDVAISPDGSLIASIGADGSIDVSTLPDLNTVWTSDEGRTLLSVIFDDGGATVATVGLGGIEIYDAQSGEDLGVHRTDFHIDAAFIDDVALILARPREFEFVDVDADETRWMTAAGHTDNVSDIAISPDGTMFASASLDGTIRLWEVSTGRGIGPPLRGHNSAVTHVDFNDDGTVLASAGIDGAYLWELDEADLAAEACAIASRVLSEAEWTALVGSSEPYEPHCTPVLATGANQRLGAAVLVPPLEELLEFDAWFVSHDLEARLEEVAVVFFKLEDAEADAESTGEVSVLTTACAEAVESPELGRFVDALNEAPDDVLLDAGGRIVFSLSRAVDRCAAGEGALFGSDDYTATVTAFQDFNTRMLYLLSGDRGLRPVGE